MTRRLQARVSGRVQGVGFRYFVMAAAQKRGLAGFVRNLVSGQVEVVAEGPVDQLQVLLSQLHQGPPGARVTEVQVSWGEPTGEAPPFTIRGTSY